MSKFIVTGSDPACGCGTKYSEFVRKDKLGAVIKNLKDIGFCKVVIKEIKGKGKAKVVKTIKGHCKK